VVELKYLGVLETNNLGNPTCSKS